MAKISIPGGGVGGLDPDELTAVAADVRKGKIAGVNGSDDPVTGTLDIPAANILAGKSIGGVAGTATNDGTITAGCVYSGKIGYSNGVKITGTMTVGSILNFSAQAYSGRQILLKWQNPYAATGKPFSGVMINYSTSGYPGTGGTRIYTGFGNNSASGGWSQVIATLPALNTTYYFSCIPYSSCSAGDLWGNTLNASAATQSELWLTFTSSQNYTIPSGFNTADFFTVGGGASGDAGDVSAGGGEGGGGGGGGYTSTIKNLSVSSGQVLAIVVGSGGISSTTIAKAGNSTSITRNGTVICSAEGGKSNNGGSGGGACGYEHATTAPRSGGCHGGSDGSAGYGQDGHNGTPGGVIGGSYSGTGQGTTTRAWGASSGALYSGGGGGGGSTYGTGGVTPTSGGNGGAGGGGRGGNSAWEDYSEDLGSSYYSGTPGSPGGANTGGGGGGSGWQSRAVGKYDRLPSGAGGSGVALVHLY